jgi:hypothetical protein
LTKQAPATQDGLREGHHLRQGPPNRKFRDRISGGVGFVAEASILRLGCLDISVVWVLVEDKYVLVFDT